VRAAPKEVPLKALLFSIATAVGLFVAVDILHAAEPETMPMPAEVKEPPKVDSGDTAWMLTSTG
jgi:hypothetical protein